MTVDAPADAEDGGSGASSVAASAGAERPWTVAERWLHSQRWLRWPHWIVALAGYIALTLALTFPLIFHLGDSIMGPVIIDDSLWYTWYPYAFRTALRAGQDPSTTHLLYALLPSIQLFAASDINGALGALLLSVLVPLAVFNLLTLLNFILSGFTTYLLVGELVRSRWAAFLAGAMFTFSTYHYRGVLSGLSVTALQWMPLAAYAVLVFYRRPSWRHAIIMGVSLALLPLSDLYTTAYFLPLFALGIVGGLVVVRRDWLRQGRHLLQAGVGLGVTALITLPLLASSLRVDPAEQAAIAQKATSVTQFSANVLSYIFPSPQNPLLGHLTTRPYAHIIDTANYLGLVSLALGLYGLVAIRQRTRAQVFWLIFGCGAFLLSLGTSLQVGGHSLVRLPFYGWLYNWPILSGFRAPSRMGSVVLLAVCVLAGFGLDALFARVRARLDARTASPAAAAAPVSFVATAAMAQSGWTGRRRLPGWQRIASGHVRLRQLAVPLLGVVLLCGSLAEHLQFAVPYPFTRVPMPSVYAQMAADPVPGLVLTLPLYPKGADMFYQTVYQRGLVGGYPIRTTIPMERSYENLPGVSFFDWPNGWPAKDPQAASDGMLHDIFGSSLAVAPQQPPSSPPAPSSLPPQETFLQGLQANHIRYVVLRTDSYEPFPLTNVAFPPVQPWMKPWLEQQLGAPLYDNAAQQLTVWRIVQLPPTRQDPTRGLTRFVLGDGWLPGLKLDRGQLVRGILQQAQLDISVPRETSAHLVLRVAAVGAPGEAPRTLVVNLNGTVLATHVFAHPEGFDSVDMGVVALRAGDNTLTLGSPQPCVGRAPGASYPATLDPACLMFQVAALQLLTPFSSGSLSTPAPASIPATTPGSTP